MRKKNDQHTLKTLKRETKAWGIHISGHGLEERKRFVGWLSEVMTPQEFALIIDSEVDRRSLWKVYLCEHYGP